ncbi:DUF4136 domain-containing protein [Lutibacter holmesii]|uniref:DUF4136 domain-containing protein n=1 Tax=Lutibacter holmesii TaxID=1137985 RepID=A0ABW3WQP2_9FLAO
MKNFYKTIFFIAICFMFSTNTEAQITYDYDKDVDFSVYKTYSFGGWQDDSDKIINDIDKKRILSSFKSELLKRDLDYQLAEADLVITLFFVVDHKTSTTAYTDYMGAGMGYGYGYGGGRYGGYYRPAWGWGGGYSTTSYSENDYKEGTFVIDIYDAKTKKLIWQGVSQKTINENASKRARTIPKGVAKIMKKYPVAINKKKK